MIERCPQRLERNHRGCSRCDAEYELLQAARVKHYKDGCTCDPKYIMSCPRLAIAILSLAKKEDK